MKTFRLITVLIGSIGWIERSLPHPRRDVKTIQKVDNNTGEVIAVNHLIKKYEGEHQRFYKEEIGNGDYLEWPALDNKVLSTYCKQICQYSMPGRSNDNVEGFKVKKVLSYEKENTSFTSNIFLVQCKVTMSRVLSYYITRAPEPVCVYTVKCTQSGIGYTYSIINKYCDFETISLKQKNGLFIGKIHRPTGQPIAKDKYLLEYELEHQELFKREGSNCMQYKYIKWPHAMRHASLDLYCYQYIKECVPRRIRGSITGNWKTMKLHYQKLNSNEDIKVTTVTCQVPYKTRRHYYITRAPEMECVYALIPKGRNSFPTLVIGYKHCDFESSNNLQTLPRGHYNIGLDKYVIPKIEVKTERFGTLEMLQLFPKEN